MGVKLRERKKKDGSSSLYLDIYFQGKRKYEFLNIHLSNKRKFSKEDKEKKEIAEKLRITKNIELAEQINTIVDLNNEYEYFFDFFNHIVKTENKTHPYWKALSKKLKDYSDENLSFSSITEVWIINFQKYLLKKASKNTAFLYMKCLNYIFKEVKRKNVIRYNPIESIPKKYKVKREAVEKTYLTITEIEKLSKIQTTGIKTEYLQIFLFCCFTGLRWSDVNGLKWTNIVKLKSGAEKVIRFKQKKTGKQEYLPISKQALKILTELKQAEKEYVFHQISEKIQKTESYNALHIISNYLKLWAKEINLKKNIHFHVSRHTFATMALTSGVDLYTVSKLLGHSDINTTIIYAKVVDEKKIQAVANLPKLNFNKN